MARTIYFNDGSREVLLSSDNEKQELERILRERLGDDTAELFLEIAEANVALEDELKSCESSCEDYRNLLQDTHDELNAILGFTQKLNCQKITASIQRLIKTINSIL